MIRKIIIKDDIIELYDNENLIKKYRLDETNIKYDIKRGRYGSKNIYIMFNNDKFTASAYNCYKLEYYIAFVILVNILKTNKFENIENLDNEDIERLQKNFKYNK